VMKNMHVKCLSCIAFQRRVRRAILKYHIKSKLAQQYILDSVFRMHACVEFNMQILSGSFAASYDLWQVKISLTTLVLGAVACMPWVSAEHIAPINPEATTRTLVPSDLSRYKFMLSPEKDRPYKLDEIVRGLICL
jgi:hypothetical protein